MASFERCLLDLMEYCCQHGQSDDTLEQAVDAAHRADALAEVERALSPVIGEADWHKGHMATSCPYRQLLEAQARLGPPK